MSAKQLMETAKKKDAATASTPSRRKEIEKGHAGNISTFPLATGPTAKIIGTDYVRSEPKEHDCGDKRSKRTWKRDTIGFS